MKKLLLLSMLCFYFYGTAQIINPGIFGQNAQLTKEVGTNTTINGKLDLFWERYGVNSGQNYILESKTQFMRYDGNQVETFCLIDGAPTQGPINPSNLYTTIQDYIKKAKAMEDNGIEPMLALPLKFVAPTMTTFAQVATQAAQLVLYVNNGLTATPNTYTGGFYKPVVFWIYSNEPDLPGGNHPYDGYDAAQQIHAYILEYYTKVNSIWNPAWNTTYTGPQYVGPELYAFDNWDHNSGGSTNKVKQLIEQLTGHYNQVDGTTTGPTSDDFDIRSMISVFTWHYYPFNDESFDSPTSYIPKPTRSNVIDALATGAPRPADGLLTSTLAADIALIRGLLTPTYSYIKLGITEANICHINDVGVGTNPTLGSDDLITGNGANSLIAGQFWAEMMSICMKESVSHLDFWSSLEGNGDYKTNVGFLNSDPAKFGGEGGKKPTYQHFKLLADNFNAQHVPSTFQSTSLPVNQPNVKAFAAQSGNRVAVMILNQSLFDYDFSVKLDGTTSSSALNISFGMSFTPSPAPYVGSGSDANHLKIKNQSTVLLLFDCKGNISERYDYTITNAQNNEAPQQTTFGNPLLTAFPTVTFVGPTSPIQAGLYGTFNMFPNTWNYTWDPNVISNNIYNSSVDLLAGSANTTVTYTYTVTDLKGCKASSGISIEAGGLITGDEFQAYLCGAVTPSSCGMNTGAAAVCAGGGNTYSYKWDGGVYITSSSMTGLAPGLHTVVVKNAPPTVNGITKTLQFNVPVTGVQPTAYTFNAPLGTQTWTMSNNPFSTSVNPIRISTSLTFPANSNITMNNMNFVFDQGAKIIIERGGSLTLNNTKLTSYTGCGNGMWQGIEVWGTKDSTLSTAGAQGKLILTNNSIIENAMEGISTIKTNANGTQDFNFTGGIVRATNSTFRNCWRAV